MADDTEDVLDNWEDEDAEVSYFIQTKYKPRKKAFFF